LNLSSHQSLLLKPKVLDLLATKLSVGGTVDTRTWVGESNLIEWFWETEVCKQPNTRMRAGFLKSLGEKQADNLEVETPTDVFSISDLAQLDSLISDRFCQEREERLSFCHDLYGDWARQRILLGKANNLREYIEPRISSPLWHRAVRLYGLHLLEQHEDITKWRDALMAWETDANSPNLAQDLLLEAVIFAANPQPLLERLWSDLATNNGLLLRRLLGRFLHVATLPNPMMREIFSQDSETLAATVNRIPYWLYWLPMLKFLHQHLDEAIELAPKQIAEIAGAWLWRSGTDSPLRQEAAELALALAEKIQYQYQEERFRSSDDKLEETVYRAALAGVNELPERLTTFVLPQCDRKFNKREYIKQRFGVDPETAAPDSFVGMLYQDTHRGTQLGELRHKVVLESSTLALEEFVFNGTGGNLTADEYTQAQERINSRIDNDFFAKVNWGEGSHPLLVGTSTQQPKQLKSSQTKTGQSPKK
jgi:hypothetical protein